MITVERTRMKKSNVATAPYLASNKKTLSKYHAMLYIVSAIIKRLNGRVNRMKWIMG